MASGLEFRMLEFLDGTINMPTDFDDFPKYFYDDIRTRVIDQDQCVYYTRFGTTVRDETNYPSYQQCTAWPPRWTNEIPPASSTMDVYLSKDEIGINRIDFHDGSGNYGYQETCVQTITDVDPSELP